MNDFVKEECCNCGVLFAVSSRLQGNWKRTKAPFYCPNGHGQSYIKSTADELREQLREKDGQISDLNSEVMKLLAKNRTAKGANKKKK